MIVVVIASLIFVVLWRLLSTGLRRSAETTDEVEFVSGARAVMQNLTRDVNAAQTFLAPSGADERLVVFRNPKQLDLKARLTANQTEKTYPLTLSKDNVVHKFPGLRVIYRYDPQTRAVSREESAGTLEIHHSDLQTVSELKFEGDASSPRTLMSRVQAFDTYFVAYDEKGQLKKVETGDIPKASSVAVALKAETPEQSGRRTIELDLVTKVWINRRIQEVMYPEYFSSSDDDVTF